MKIELFHASKFGNGAMIAEELRRIAETSGHQMNVHHIDDARPKEMPAADMYIFGSPTRFGGPIGGMRRFIKKVVLPPGTKYAIFATHADQIPDKKTGTIPSEEELGRLRKTIPDLDEILKAKQLVKVAEQVFQVSPDTMRGPLKEGWRDKAKELATAVLRTS